MDYFTFLYRSTTGISFSSTLIEQFVPRRISYDVRSKSLPEGSRTTKFSLNNQVGQTATEATGRRNRRHAGTRSKSAKTNHQIQRRMNDYERKQSICSRLNWLSRRHTASYTGWRAAARLTCGQILSTATAEAISVRVYKTSPTAVAHEPLAVI